MLRLQQTLRNSFTCRGIGLHSGKRVLMTVYPAPEDSGIVFVRTDVGVVEIAAMASNTAATSYATTLRSDGAAVRTVEHLLGAFAGLGVDNAVIELDGDEVPIMDGSAGPFIRMIAEAGVRTQEKVQPAIRVTRPVFVRENGKQLAIWPAEQPSISFFIDFDHPLLREQSLTYAVSQQNFIREVADARTFGFLSDVQALQAAGLARGGSLENAIVLGEDAVLNDGGLRYRDEFVRHKILDLVGDLSLAGMPVIGHVVAHKSGHGLNAQMVQKLLESPLSWELAGDADAVAARRETQVYREPAVL